LGGERLTHKKLRVRGGGWVPCNKRKMAMARRVAGGPVLRKQRIRGGRGGQRSKIGGLGKKGHKDCRTAQGTLKGTVQKKVPCQGNF